MSKAKYISKLVDASGSTTSANVSYTGTLTGSTGILNIGSGQLYKDASGNVGIGTTSPASKLDIGSGNLNFSGTSQRITGDMSNATITNRLAFQTSTANGNTTLTILPNGTSVASSIVLEGDSAQTNGSFFGVALTASGEARITSGVRGTGTYLPITMLTGGSERMRIDASGNVGIGTSSPRASKLDVLSATGTQNTTADSPGLVNITGPSGPSGAQPLFVLGVNDALAANIGPAITFQARYLTSSTAAANIAYIAAIRENATSGNVQGAIIFNPRNAAGNFPEAMRIDSSGNVGIGTSSPSTAFYKLTVAGDAGAGAGIVIKSDSSTSAISRIGFTRDGTDGTTGLIRVANNDYSMQFWTANGTSTAERMRIDSSGNVGIGTSSTYLSSKFTSSNTANTPAGVFLRPITITNAISVANSYIYMRGQDNGYGLAIGNYSSTQWIQGMVNDAPSLDIALNPSGGNVGIGTSIPTAKLEVSGGTSSPIVILSATSGNPGSGVKLLGTSGYKNWQVSSSLVAVAGALEFTPSTAAGGSTFTTPAMIIDSSGNVGIGTTAPNNKLTVGIPNGVVGAVCVASFSGANVAASNSSGMVVITPTDSIAANIGGSIGFAANGTLAGYPTGSISGRRENATAGDYSSYMQFTTSGSNGSVQEKMRIDSAGRITTPSQPAFHATSANAPTTGVEWVFNAVTFNRGNYYNATTGRFTAPVTGVYYFYAFGLAGNADTSDIRFSLRVNSATFAGARFIITKSAASWQTIRGQAVMNLNAGDYVSPWNDQSAIAFHTDPNYTGFGGYLIG